MIIITADDLLFVSAMLVNCACGVYNYHAVFVDKSNLTKQQRVVMALLGLSIWSSLLIRLGVKWFM